MVDLFLLPWAFFDRCFLLFSLLACFFAGLALFLFIPFFFNPSLQTDTVVSLLGLGLA